MKTAVQLHQNVPPDWYACSIKDNIFQRFWHKTRFREIGKFVNPIGGVILDIGCADGTLTKVIASQTHPRKIVGIDVMPKAIAFAKRRFAKNKRFSFLVTDAHQLPFRRNVFDAIFCVDTLEHVFSPRQVLKEISRVLKKNGYVVIGVPSENLLFRIVWWFWGKWRGKIWEGTHLHNFSKSFLENMLRDCGFKIVENKKILLGMLHFVKAVKQ